MTDGTSQAIAPRYLTKSRFKLAVEYPTKLYCAGKSAYQDNSLGDSFLAALSPGELHSTGDCLRVRRPTHLRDQ